MELQRLHSRLNFLINEPSATGDSRLSGPPSPHTQDPTIETLRRALTQRVRHNEAGDGSPGSQELLPRGVQNLHCSRIAPTMGRPESRRLRQRRQPSAFLRRAHCGGDPEAYVGGTWSRSMRRRCSSPKASLRQMVWFVWRVAPTIRSKSAARCNTCPADTATRDPTVGDIFQDRRQAGKTQSQKPR